MFASSSPNQLRDCPRYSSGPKLVAAVLALFFAQACFGFGNGQWDWKVVGLSATYVTKQAAFQALTGRGGNYAYLNKEEGLSGMNQGWATYKYSVSPRNPQVLTDWVYHSGNIHLSSEEAVYAAVYANLAANLSHPNCPPILTPRGGWVIAANAMGIPTAAYREFDDIRFGWDSQNGCIQGTPLSYTMWRDRSAGCQAPFTQNVAQQNCVLAHYGYIEKRPCSCEKLTKNPCEVVTGSKSQTEVDYSGPGPRFVRNYHSLEPQGFSGLGIGWSHNYSQQLVVSSGEPMGVLNAAGYLEPFSMRWIVVNGQSAQQWISRTGSGVSVERDGSEFILFEKSNARQRFNAAGRLTKLIDPSGRESTVSYNSSGYISEVAGPFGHKLIFHYTGVWLTSVDGPGGVIAQFSTDAAGNLASVTYSDSTSRTYHYEDTSFPNHLTGLTGEDGVRFKTATYDSLGRVLTSDVGAAQERVTLSYNGATTTVTDAAGGTQVYTFTTDANNPRKVTSLLDGANMTSWVIPTVVEDIQRRPTETTDPRGFKTRFTLNANHVTSRTDAYTTARARTTSFSFLNDRSDLPTVVTEPNRVTTNTYNSLGNVLTRTITDTSVSPNVSRVWTYTYNSYGQVLTEDGPRTDVSDITTYTYYTCTTGYQCGQLYTVTNALGHVTTYNSYNAHGQPTQITDANGLVTSLAYDLRQRITDRCTGSTLPGCSGGELTHMDYWPTGLLKKVTNPDASYIEYTYDSAHRLTQLNDGALNKIVYTLDNASNRTAENTYDPSNALRRTHTRVFNTLNQLWKDVNAAGTANVTTTFGYDGNGNQTSVNAPLSRNSASLYDELNRLKQITDPASGITQLGYDANDNLTSVTDPRNLVTSYTYTGFGDLKTQTSPDTGLTTNTYDSGGNLDTSTDSRGAVTDYGYDAANRVTSASFTLGGVTDQTISYTYDTGANQNGRLTSASDANHTLAWTYDTQGRVTGKGQTVGGTTLAMGYGYNSVGQLGTMQLPSGANVAFGYNANGQVTSLTLNGSALLSGITYDPFGPITSWTWGNGTAANRAFDTDGKITQVDNAAGLSLKNYGYDDAFRITGITDAVDSSLSWTYGYDSLDRLNAASKTGTTQGWTYDANGNRLTQTGTTPSTYTNSGTSNRVGSISGSLPRVYAYDNAGNTLSYAGATFTYNNRGRVATAANGGVTASYVYNALGQRVSRTASGVTTLYAYDEAGHLVGEYTAAGALIQETVWLGDLPVATLRPNDSGGVNLYYVHADHLNTPRLVTDTSNNVRWKWDSDPFGTSTPNENPSGLGVFAYNLRFPGQQFDPVVGLHYNYFRDYDPAVGRYVESDPIGLMGGLNTYLYASATPSSLSDPSGMNPATGAVWGGNAGTAIGGALGGPPGALAGRLIGSGIGAGLGFLILACTDNYEEKCNERFAKEEARCNRFRGRGPKEDPDRWYRACVTRAADRRNLCYSNKGPSNDEPGEYGDRDIP